MFPSNRMYKFVSSNESVCIPTPLKLATPGPEANAWSTLPLLRGHAEKQCSILMARTSVQVFLKIENSYILISLTHHEILACFVP